MSSYLDSLKEWKTLAQWKAWFLRDTLNVQPLDPKARGVKRRSFENHNQPLECSHPVLPGGLCFTCGRRNTLTAPEEHRVPFRYVLDDFSLSRNEIAVFRSIHTEINLLKKKKLFLVLDLDNTLLHSISIGDLRNEDLAHFWDLKKEDITHVREFKSILKKNIFFLTEMRMFMKLRPFAIEFLTEASKMFELYIYTTGSRDYANTIANLLDPDEIHFDWRVIARVDSTIEGQKRLDVVLGEERAVVIVDDKESVWGKDAKNVLPIRPYYFWEKDREKMRKDNVNGGGDVDLEFMLATLKKLHCLFFHETSIADLMKSDVRLLMKPARKDYLSYLTTHESPPATATTATKNYLSPDMSAMPVVYHFSKL